MADTPVHYIDLDKIVSKKATIRLNGTDHSIVAPTVEIFLANIASVKGMSETPSVEEEMEVAVEVLLRSFPTVKKEEFYALGLEQLQALQNFAQDFAKDAPAEGEGNPQTAG